MKTLPQTLALVLALGIVAGCKEAPPPPPEPPRAATIDGFAASQNVVSPGEEITLTWETTDADSVTLSTLSGEEIQIGAERASSGSLPVVVEADVTFVLTARGGGGSDQALVAVAVADNAKELFFAAFPPEIAAGDEVSIVWNAPSAVDLEIRDAEGNVVYAGDERSGSRIVRPNQSTIYSLQVRDRTLSAEVVVSPAVHVFASESPSAPPDGAIRLSWKVAGAAEVFIESEGRGTIATYVDPATIADGSFEEPVPRIASERNGLVTYRLIARRDDMVAERDLTIYVGVDPVISAFHVPPFAREAGTYQISWATMEATRLQIAVDGTPVWTATSQMQIDSWFLELPTPAADAEVTLTASNDRGGSTSMTLPVSPVGIPTTGTFTTPLPTLVHGGDPASLSWNVPNARHIAISVRDGPVIAEITGKQAESGTLDAYPNGLTEYVLQADNTVGDFLSPELSLSVDVTTPARWVFDPPYATVGDLVDITGHTSTSGGASVSGLPAVAINDGTAQFVDISTTGIDMNYVGPGLTADEVTLPETFRTRVFGVPVEATEISVSINGWFVFGSSTESWNSFPLPFPTVELEPLAIAPYAENLYDVASSEIYIQIDTDLGERRLIVQWDKVEYDPVAGSQATFQAQVYESGRIVFAYAQLDGYTNAVPSVGVINVDETGALVVPAIPKVGDAFTLFGSSTLPASVVAGGDPIVGRVLIGADAFIEIADTPVDRFSISEVNISPASTLPNGQWIEILNDTPMAIDMGGWTLDFGTSGTLTLPVGTSVSAGDHFVLSQSAGAGDGLAVDFVYGASLTVAPGDLLALSDGSEAVTSVQAPSVTPPPGVAWQWGPPADGMTVVGVTRLDCAAAITATYGTNGQRGTPGSANTACPNLAYEGSVAANFESIALTGNPVTFANLDDDIATIALPSPVLVDGLSYTQIVVGTNGYIALTPITCSDVYCYSTNEASLNPTVNPPGLIAPFWDDNDTTQYGGVYWERKTPGVTPGDGYTVVSWENVHHFTSGTATESLNFQVKFFDTGDVEFHFGTMTGAGTAWYDGRSATTWFEHPSGAAAFIVNVNSSTSPGIQSNTAFRFAAQ